MRKLKNRLKNVGPIIFTLIFLFWLSSSVYVPIQNLIYGSGSFDLIYGMSGIAVVSGLIYKIAPALFKKNGETSLNFNVGNTKDKISNKTKGGCTSCKKNKK
tara:strand:+ start:304 stop:609 length:306 start_codon:yes stop_codon:yes gene_type:complete